MKIKIAWELGRYLSGNNLKDDLRDKNLNSYVRKKKSKIVLVQEENLIPKLTDNALISLLYPKSV
ncbi:hypothetical protein PL9631_770101 [Planktothrix paucivesiculata PCC 9631]|uniref:Uncharacterized protein n=1 Tax=Planktothrix paucivesiculata PCC 9631 TaxID=671071 RepID=A0A7Z9C246_9CYAN|nr:hypothetical protein PL9631_770101 [Planktothrix paucivesiculata PCC 9631]